jgi:predicted kinase
VSGGAPLGDAWIVCGAPGAGKSVLGAALAADRRAVLLDQDVATGPLTEVVASLAGAQPRDLDDPRVRVALGAAPYDVLLDLGAANLAIGNDVVLVAPFTRLLATGAGARAVWSRLRPASLRILRATCPPDELMRRLGARGSARDRRKLEDASRFLAVERMVAVVHRPIDTTRPLSDQLTAARTAPVVPVEPDAAP